MDLELLFDGLDDDVLRGDITVSPAHPTVRVSVDSPVRGDMAADRARRKGRATPVWSPALSLGGRPGRHGRRDALLADVVRP
jgi:hypothetical protein